MKGIDLPGIARLLLPAAAERIGGESLEADLANLLALGASASPAARARLAPEAGRCIEARLGRHRFRFELAPDGSLRLMAPAATRADLRVSGSLEDWVRAGMGLDSALEVEGEAALASRLHALLDEGRPRLRDLASAWIGPGAGRLAARWASRELAQARGWAAAGDLRERFADLAAEALEQGRKLKALAKSLERSGG